MAERIELDIRFEFPFDKQWAENPLVGGFILPAAAAVVQESYRRDRTVYKRKVPTPRKSQD